MKLTRKNFLKLSGLTAVSAFLGSIPLLIGCSKNKLKGTEKVTSICPFCSVGCGIIISVRESKIINIEGDPAHPINSGTLCAKGSAAFQLSEANRSRLTNVLYRAPYSAEWKVITWAEALKKIAENIKNTRDKSFIEYEGKNTVNRTPGIAVMAGSALNNEEYYLMSKMSRILGITCIGNESDLSNTAAGIALSASLGYGAMTNHWIDMRNSDVILIIGSNPVENQSISSRHILKAKENGAKIIHVDPRYTMTSAIADYHAAIRPGTDIAFIGGIINFALKNNRIQKEYLLEYTNASHLINNNYEFNRGLFSGFKTGKYDNSTWDGERDKKGIPKIDKTLKADRTVFRIIENHFSRYTPDIVSAVTGCPSELFLKIADIFTSTGKPEKSGSIMFSSGITQHTSGTQNVRALTILQLLLGNIGIAGGGLNSIQEGAGSQAAQDHGMLPGYLSGYMPAPSYERHTTLDSYIKDITPLTNDPMSINILTKRNIQITNILKAFYGNTASKENDFCFHWLPKINKPYHQKLIFREMQKGVIRGAFFAGTNPVMSTPSYSKNITAIENLDWIIISDIFETETASFWKRAGVKPEKIKTEVFLLPAASILEKEGSTTNSGRWVQWRNKAAQPPGQSRSDLWIIDRIFSEIKKQYQVDKNAIFPDSILGANWNYSLHENDPDPEKVAIEINGYEISTGKPADNFSQLKENGSTAAGNWLYCGSYSKNENLMARRITKDSSNKAGLYPKWSWSWPGNSRVLYNRASVNRKGEPWNPGKWLMQWDDEWEGDIVNGGETSGPAEKNPFIMLMEGIGKLFTNDLTDGPLPEHYEPVESPAANIMGPVNYNPLYLNSAELNQAGNIAKFPYVATTYKKGYEWKAGLMSMNISWINELIPAGLHCEISRTLAEAKGLKSGDKVQIQTGRGKMISVCIVTDRIQQLTINGRKTEMIGIVMNSGYSDTRNNFNHITHDIADPNCDVPELKAFLADIRKEA